MIASAETKAWQNIYFGQKGTQALALKGRFHFHLEHPSKTDLNPTLLGKLTERGIDAIRRDLILLKLEPAFVDKMMGIQPTSSEIQGGIIARSKETGVLFQADEYLSKKTK